MSVTPVDLAVLVGACLMALVGHRLGLLATTVWLLGAAAGLILGCVVVGAVFAITGPLVPLAGFIMTMVVLVGLALIGAMLGLAGAERLGGFSPSARTRSVDAWGGVAVAVVAAMVGLWVLTPTLAAEGPLRSGAARRVAAVAPMAPDAVGDLRTKLGDIRWARLQASLHPEGNQGPPPTRVDVSEEARARVEAATYLVEGLSCQRMQDGTAFVVEEGVLVTNAHVVAGVEGHVKLYQPGRHAREARVTYFDAGRDLALLRMAETPPPVPMSDRPATVGTVGAVFGHPDGSRELRQAPARVDRVIDAMGRDLYNTNPTRRRVMVLATHIRAGYSGGPVVNASGQLIGVAFAVAPDRSDVAFALAPSELEAAVSAEQGMAVSTGPCVG